MQQWDCDRDGWVRWRKCETIFTFRYIRFDAKVIHFWHWMFLLMIWIMIIFDVNYYLWRRVWLFVTWLMMIFVVLSVYVMHILSLNSSGNDIPNRKTTVRSRQKAKRHNLLFSGRVSFENIWVTKIHHFCQGKGRRMKGVHYL